MRRRWTSTVLVTVSIFMAHAASSFGSSFGTLCNFDVVNDTGSSCHGFEIELEDIHTTDVPYTFGATYIRYGVPEVVDATTDPAHPRVIVRYRHWSGSQWEATPVAPAGASASGHDCYSGGPVGNYLSSGCEHFGVSLSATPSRTTYRWLVAANPSDPGTAFSVVPETVNLPVPVWNVVPRAGGGVDVRAEVEPVEEENHAQYGEPQWIKVFKVESDQDLQPEDLDRLLLGLADGLVPDNTEVETEWKLIQSRPGNAEGAAEDADVKEDPLGDGKRSVVRRYEFHSYTGPRDPENNEAVPCVADDSPVSAAAPVNGCSDLGDFVGAQNVAVDVDLATVDHNLPAGQVGVAYTGTALVIGGLAPYLIEVTGGAVPGGLQVDGVTGLLSGTPTQAGAFSFGIRATDGAGAVTTGTFDVAVGGDTCPDDPDKDAPGVCGCGSPDVDSDGDGSADCVDLCPDDPVKGEPGVCDCGVADSDTNGNGIADCREAVRADLAMTVVRRPLAEPQAGKRLRFALRATNLGPDPVPGVTIRATISGGPLSGLKLPKSCSGSEAEIICSTGMVSGSRPSKKTRRISVIPASGAIITVTSTVSSAVYDPNPANQTASLTALVP